MKEELNKNLLNAANKGDLAAVKEAIENGADIEAKDKNEETALHFASSWGRLETVKYLEKEESKKIAPAPKGRIKNGNQVAKRKKPNNPN